MIKQASTTKTLKTTKEDWKAVFFFVVFVSLW